MFFNNRLKLLRVGSYYRAKPRVVTAGDITQIIRRQFPSTDFSFFTNRDYAVDYNMVVVSGTYDSYFDDDGLPSIELSLCYHPEQTEFQIDTLNWDRISFDIAECIGHEIVHKQQHESKIKFRKYTSQLADVKRKAEQEYLGDETEIDAFGFSIAAEMVCYKRTLADCEMYQIYRNCFDNDHSLIVKLEKQVSKYFNELELKNEQAN
jgi:hypothetical protein